MSSLSLSMIWEETVAFLRRESGLLVPVALATFAPAQILLSYATAAIAATTPQAASASPATLLMLPALLLVVYGNLTISLMALSPGISVREALLGAARRLPVTVTASLLVGAIFVGIVVTITVVAAILLGAASMSASPALSAFATIVTAVVVARFLLLLPMLAVENIRPLEAVRRAWALSRRHFLRFAAIILLSMMLASLLALVNMIVLGSVGRIVGGAVGATALADLVQLIIGAGLAALLSAAVAVFIAFTYRRVRA